MSKERNIGSNIFIVLVRLKDTNVDLHTGPPIFQTRHIPRVMITNDQFFCFSRCELWGRLVQIIGGDHSILSVFFVLWK